jgi:hypothetical protein
MSTETWSLNELAPKLGLPEASLVRPAVESWASRGVLKSVGNGEYRLLERSEEHPGSVRRPVIELEGGFQVCARSGYPLIAVVAPITISS